MDLFGKKAKKRKAFLEMANAVMKTMQESHPDPESYKDRRYDSIMAALSRPRLEGLQFGDLLRQKKLGEEYLYKGEGAPVVFVRYATQDDQPKLNGGEAQEDNDIVVADYVDTRDGQLMKFFVNSTHYERVE